MILGEADPLERAKEDEMREGADLDADALAGQILDARDARGRDDTVGAAREVGDGGDLEIDSDVAAAEGVDHRAEGEIRAIVGQGAARVEIGVEARDAEIDLAEEAALLRNVERRIADPRRQHEPERRLGPATEAAPGGAQRSGRERRGEERASREHGRSPERRRAHRREDASHAA